MCLPGQAHSSPAQVPRGVARQLPCWRPRLLLVHRTPDGTAPICGYCTIPDDTMYTPCHRTHLSVVHPGKHRAVHVARDLQLRPHRALPVRERRQAAQAGQMKMASCAGAMRRWKLECAAAMRALPDDPCARCVQCHAQLACNRLISSWRCSVYCPSSSVSNTPRSSSSASLARRPQGKAQPAGRQHGAGGAHFRKGGACKCIAANDPSRNAGAVAGFVNQEPPGARQDHTGNF